MKRIINAKVQVIIQHKQFQSQPVDIKLNVLHFESLTKILGMLFATWKQKQKKCLPDLALFLASLNQQEVTLRQENSLRSGGRLHGVISQVGLILSLCIMLYRIWKRLWQGPGVKLSYLLIEMGLLEQPTKTYLLFFDSADMRTRKRWGRPTHKVEQANLIISIHPAAFFSLPTFTDDKFQWWNSGWNLHKADWISSLRTRRQSLKTSQ